MNLRPYVAFIYAIAFIVALLAIVSIPSDLWPPMLNYEKGFMAFYILVGFCGVLIAYWVYEDDQKLHDLEEEKRGLERRLSELNGKLFASSLSADSLKRKEHFRKQHEEKRSLEERISDLESKNKT